MVYLSFNQLCQCIASEAHAWRVVNGFPTTAHVTKMHPNDGPRHERAAGRRSVDARMQPKTAMLDRFDFVCCCQLGGD